MICPFWQNPHCGTCSSIHACCSGCKAGLEDVVTAIVQAKQGVSTVQVALLDALPSAPPPAGYRVTAVVINPQLITLSGAQDAVTGIQSITLPAVSLAPYTSDHTFNVRIPNSDPRIHLSTAVVQVTYKIARNPAVSPTP